MLASVLAWAGDSGLSVAAGVVHPKKTPVARASTSKVPRRWFSSKLRVSAVPAAESANFPKGSRFETRMFQRLELDSKKRPFRIASISYAKIPKRNSELGIAQAPLIAEDLRKGLGIEAWQERAYRGARAYEGVWKSDQRFVRLFVKEDSRTVTVSVGMYRMAYALPAVVEGELLQRRLVGALEIRVPWIQRIVARAAAEMDGWFSRDAWAGSSGCTSASPTWPSCLSSSWGSGTSGSSGSSTSLAGIAQSLNQISTELQAIDDVADSVDGLKDQVAVTGQDIQDTTVTQVDRVLGLVQQESHDIQILVGEEMDETQKMMGDEISHLNKEIDETQAFAAEKFDEATALLQSTSDKWYALVESRTTPEYIGLVAGVAAAASGLASFAVSAAIDGLLMGGKALIDVLSGAKNRRELLAAFIQARQTWEMMKPELSRLEQQNDLMLQSLDVAVATGKSRSDALADIAHLLAPVRAKAEAIKARIALNVLDEVCTAELYKEQWAVVNSVRPHLKTLCVLDPGNAALASFKELLPVEFASEFSACKIEGISGEGFEKTCAAAKKNLDALVELDSTMHDLGFKIAAGADVYEEEVVLPAMHADRKAQFKADRRGHKTEKAAERGNRIGRRNEETKPKREFKRARHKFMMGCLAGCRLRGSIPYSDPGYRTVIPSWKVENRDPRATTGPYPELACLEGKGAYPEPLPAESEEYRQLTEACDAWWDDPSQNEVTREYLDRLARIDEIMQRPTEALDRLKRETAAAERASGESTLDSAALREHARILELVASIKADQAGYNANQARLKQKARDIEQACRTLRSRGY